MVREDEEGERTGKRKDEGELAERGEAKIWLSLTNNDGSRLAGGTIEPTLTLPHYRTSRPSCLVSRLLASFLADILTVVVHSDVFAHVEVRLTVVKGHKAVSL